MSMPIKVAQTIVNMMYIFRDRETVGDYSLAEGILDTQEFYHGYRLNENDMAVILRMVLDGRVVPAAATVGELTD